MMKSRVADYREECDELQRNTKAKRRKGSHLYITLTLEDCRGTRLLVAVNAPERTTYCSRDLLHHATAVATPKMSAAVDTVAHAVEYVDLFGGR